MREIKFRAWEHTLKEMIEVDDIQFYRGDDINIDGIELKPLPRNEQPIMINTRSAWRIANDEDVTLMQYTGLHNKNGKEIYEGDVVDIEHPCWTQRCITEFRNGSFIFRQLFGEGKETIVPGFSFMREKWEVKVIGNIYENPELLK